MPSQPGNEPGDREQACPHHATHTVGRVGGALIGHRALARDLVEARARDHAHRRHRAEEKKRFKTLELGFKPFFLAEY